MAPRLAKAKTELGDQPTTTSPTRGRGVTLARAPATSGPRGPSHPRSAGCGCRDRARAAIRFPLRCGRPACLSGGLGDSMVCVTGGEGHRAAPPITAPLSLFPETGRGSQLPTSGVSRRVRSEGADRDRPTAGALPCRLGHLEGPSVPGAARVAGHRGLDGCQPSDVLPLGP